MGAVQSKAAQRAAARKREVEAANKFPGWVARVDGKPTVQLDMHGALPAEVIRLFSMVACYTDAFIGCGCCFDKTLALLLSGEMDNPKSIHLGADWFLDGIRDYYREDGKYAEQLMEVVEAIGAWPRDWYTLVPLGPYIKQALGFDLGAGTDE